MSPRDPRLDMPPAADLKPDSRARARAAMEVARWLELPEKLRPLRTECVVLLDGKANETEGGIIIAPLLQDQPTSGVVLAVAARCTAVEVGERVAVGKYNGRRVDDSTSQRLGYEPGQLWILQAVGDKGAPHVAADHVLGVIEEEG